MTYMTNTTTTARRFSETVSESIIRSYDRESSVVHFHLPILSGWMALTLRADGSGVIAHHGETVEEAYDGRCASHTDYCDLISGPCYVTVVAHEGADLERATLAALRGDFDDLRAILLENCREADRAAAYCTGCDTYGDLFHCHTPRG